MKILLIVLLSIVCVSLILVALDYISLYKAERKLRENLSMIKRHRKEWEDYLRKKGGEESKK